MPVRKVRISMTKRDTTPDPVYVRAGDKIQWSCTKPWKFEVAIQKRPKRSGKTANPCAGPHPWKSINGKATTGKVKKGVAGHYYKTKITVWPPTGGKIVIDPHIIIDY